MVLSPDAIHYECYVWIFEILDKGGDKISVFGCAHGAHIAGMLSGMIHKVSRLLLNYVR